MYDLILVVVVVVFVFGLLVHEVAASVEARFGTLPVLNVTKFRSCRGLVVESSRTRRGVGEGPE